MTHLHLPQVSRVALLDMRIQLRSSQIHRLHGRKSRENALQGCGRSSSPYRGFSDGLPPPPPNISLAQSSFQVSRPQGPSRSREFPMPTSSKGLAQNVFSVLTCVHIRCSTNASTALAWLLSLSETFPQGRVASLPVASSCSSHDCVGRALFASIRRFLTWCSRCSRCSWCPLSSLHPLSRCNREPRLQTSFHFPLASAVPFFLDFAH